MKSVIASASLSGGMNAIMRTVSIAVPMKTKLVVGPSTLAIGTRVCDGVDLCEGGVLTVVVQGAAGDDAAEIVRVACER